jgi:uncharacterized radical SAM superfamily Fe-S cluster-containing enzyme
MEVEPLYEFLKKLPNRIIIRLIGAEATVRKDLPDIIRNVKKCGHQVSLTTNGLKLSSKKYVQKLKKSGLRMVLLSMNGAADPDVYAILDNGREYAEMKHKALINCMESRMIINTGTIIAKGSNEFTLRDQIDLVRKTMKETNYRVRIKPILRFKSVGHIGRYMKDSTYTLPELEDVFKYYVQDATKVDDIVSPNHAILANFYELDDMYVRLIDWTIDDDGIPDSDNEYRGRVTQDWKVAPFFEHLKLNEFGY